MARFDLSDAEWPIIAPLLPIRLALTPGQASDKDAALALIASLNRTQGLIADRGYDATYILDAAQARGAVAHIPTQRDRKLARNFLAAVTLASIRLWTRTYESNT